MSKKHLNNGEFQLPAGKKRLFSSGTRTGILLIASVSVFTFVLLPILFDRVSGANAVYILAPRSGAVAEEETPQPLLVEQALMDEATPEPTPVPTPEIHVSQYSVLKEDDDYPAVQNLQTRLMELGYLDSDEPTTVYGHATTVAVSLFQRTLDYDMSGVADSDLQEHLFSTEALSYEMKLGDSGSDVESMQSRLNELGYYDSKINGYFGVATEDALRNFQTKNELSTDGIFNVSDRDLLYSPSARPKIDPTPTPKPTPKPTKRPSSSSSGGSSSGGGSSSSGSDSSGGGSVTVPDNSGSSSVPDEPSSGGDSTPSYSASYSPSGLVSVATAMVGYPYSWSQESPSRGFDCSGLVYYSLRTCGVSTSRYSASGFSAVGSWGNIESIDGLSTGDLVFFKNDTSSKVSHTGIYIGGGRFVHASSSAGKVLISSIGTSYWTRNFVNGRRVF